MNIFISKIIAFGQIAQAAQSNLLSPQSSPASTVEIELIREQINFLKDANTNLAESFNSLTSSFNSFTTAINIFFGITLAVITVISTISAFLGIRAIDESVKREVNRAISRKIDSKISYLEKVAGRESILDEVLVTYLSPGSVAEPPIFKMLQHRVKSIKFKVNSNNRELLQSNVVVLDLDDSNLAIDEASTVAAKDLVKELTNNLKKWAVLVVYTANNQSPVVNYLRDMSKKDELRIEYVSANMKVTLMANVIEAAHVSHALKYESLVR